MQGWKKVNLLEVAQINACLVDPRKNEYRNMVLIAPDHIQSGSGRIVARVTAADQEAISGKYFVKKNSVIYSKIRPYLMKAATVYENVLCSADMYPLECTDGIVPEFLLIVLLSDKFTMFANSCSNRTGIPKINREELSKFKLLLPSFSEQIAIADILTTWDQAIEKTEGLITTKEDYLRLLSNLLLFGKHHENVDVHLTKWFSVPTHWEIKKIGQIALEISLMNNKKESLPVLSCTKYNGLVDSLKYFDKQIFSEDTSKYKVVKKGQYAYATNHIEEGSIGYQDLYPKGLVSPMYTVFETNDEVIDGYLYKVLKTETYRHIFGINTSSSVDRRGSLRWKQFSTLPIPLPPLKEQEEINDILNLASKEIFLLKQLLVAYHKQKRGLMQKVLTGKWRVKTELEEVV